MTTTRAVLAPIDLPPRLRRAVHDASAYGEDSLTVGGPHRAVWHLSGYREVGEGASGASYFLTRWENGSRTEWVTTRVTPAGGLHLGAYDYQPREERTLRYAEALVTEQYRADVAPR